MANWEQGLKGAAGGAMAGAGLGGPAGAVVGGAIGGISGFLSGGESEQDKLQRERLNLLYGQAANRGAPQMGPAAQGGYSTFRNNQSDLVNRLDALSRGQGPSLAAQQFQAATDRNMAAQQSMAQSGRGGPLAAFNAANNMGHLGAQAAQGSAMARIQEQQMALNQLGLTLHGARGADESMNQFNANEQNQRLQANLGALLQSRQMDDNTKLQILSMLSGQNQAQKQQGAGLGDQFLAGGSGLWSFMAAQRAQQAAQQGGRVG